MTNLHEVILVVEDDAQIRNFICFALQGDGYACRTADTAAEAMRMLAAEPVDLISAELISAISSVIFSEISLAAEEAEILKITAPGRAQMSASVFRLRLKKLFLAVRRRLSLR